METVRQHREFMKSNFAALRGVRSDQSRGLPQPPLQLPCPQDAEVMRLPAVNPSVVTQRDVYQCLRDRRSHREYADANLTAEELSFLLWATQGVKKATDNGYCTFRPVPSAGARHPFETYLVLGRVDGIEPGVYRYLPLTHELLLRFRDRHAMNKIARAACDQAFLAQSAAVFVWSCVPYRGEWRYHLAAHKAMLIDAGHVCQNLYLACEAVRCGTCAVAAYDQDAVDSLLRLDGGDEFVVYLAPVGRKREDAT